MTHVIHKIPPVYNKNSQILILGSFPSVKSREGRFFYHHKQNRFWKVLSTIVNDVLPETIDEKKDFLLKNKAEVYHMCLYEFDVELHERVLREEEREEGRLEGIREGRLAGQQEGMQNGKKFAKQVFKAFMSGKTPETIAEELNVPLEEVKNLVD